MYILEGHILESVDTTTYLGIAISSNMTWNAHINNIASKAQKLFQVVMHSKGQLYEGRS
jgi:ubiquitin C-terminal hydrolase